MKRRRSRKTGKPTGGGGAKHPNSLANLIPGGTSAPIGNSHALKHGGNSEVLLRDVEAEVRELLDALADAAPVKDPDGSLPAADTVAVERAARALKRWRSVSGWLDLHGRLDDKGDVRDAAKLELACERELGRALDDLGMTPQSRSKLGLRLVQATAAASDAEDRAARDRLDRRFEGLDGAFPADVDGGRDRPGGERKGIRPGPAAKEMRDPDPEVDECADDKEGDWKYHRERKVGHGREISAERTTE
jgi:hypothetical protein